MSEKITIVFALWVLVALFLTGDENLELFFVLLFIGILVIREITDIYIPGGLKDRMNSFIYIFILVFIVIVGKKVITILGI